jgi:hypothetical protein
LFKLFKTSLERHISMRDNILLNVPLDHSWKSHKKGIFS